jgi:hypothetical protein
MKLRNGKQINHEMGNNKLFIILYDFMLNPTIDTDTDDSEYYSETCSSTSNNSSDSEYTPSSDEESSVSSDEESSVSSDESDYKYKLHDSVSKFLFEPDEIVMTNRMDTIYVPLILLIFYFTGLFLINIYKEELKIIFTYDLRKIFECSIIEVEQYDNYNYNYKY